MTSVSGERSGLYGTSPAQEKAAARPPRDRYFDALRAAAIIRIVTYHLFSFSWIALVFPSMGVMFALGGSLMAKSIERSTEQAITGRLRRLLPGLWVFGAVLIPAMIWAGWAGQPGWTTFLLWIFPIVEPPSSPWAEPAAGVLWYLVAYLWLVLLSPLLLKMYRKARLLTIIAPLVLLVAWDGLTLPVGEGVASAGTDVLTFASCWAIGFAHRAGDLRKVRYSVLIPITVACVAGGAAWAVTHPGDEGVDLANSPLAYGLYSLGFTLVLLRVSPKMLWLNRRRMMNGLVNFCNARAVTIYLWHNVAITLCFVLWDNSGIEISPGLEVAATVGIMLLLLAAFVAVFGWVEDVAARRPTRLLPWSVVPASRPRAQQPEWCGPVWF